MAPGGRIAIVAAVALFATAANAQSMNVATFLAKAEALQKKGAMALFSKDIGILKREVEGSGKLLKGERDAAAAAGRAPAYCPPAKASLNSDELLVHLRAIPPDRRGMSIKDAFAGLMRKKYPCRA